MVWWLGGSISDTIRFLGGANPKIKKQMLFVGIIQYGCFLKWWYPTTTGFPTKMTILGCEMGVPPF